MIVFAHHLFGYEQTEIAALLSVYLFFMLSGFVLARAYESRFDTGLSARRFLLVRYRRLRGPAIVGAGIGLLYFAISDQLTMTNAASFVTLALFLPAVWLPWNMFPLNYPAWSLFAEFVANATYALTRRFPTGMILCALVPGFVVVTVVQGGPRTGISMPEVLPTLISAMTTYFIGVLIFKRYGDRELRLNPMWAVIAFPAVLSVLILAPPVLAALVFALVIAPLLIRGAVGMRPKRWAALIGVLSYPLYAVHAPALQIMEHFDAPKAVAALAALSIAVLTCIALEMRPYGAKVSGKLGTL